VQSHRAFAGQELLLDVKLGTSGFQGKRLQSGLPVHVTDSVPGDLEQPTREGAMAAKAPELRERSRKDRTGDVLARSLIPNPQPHVAENTVEVTVVERQEPTRILPRGQHEHGVRIHVASTQRTRIKKPCHLHDRLIFSPSSRIDCPGTGNAGMCYRECPPGTRRKPSRVATGALLITRCQNYNREWAVLGSNQ
jgi:hypothetical protein